MGNLNFVKGKYDSNINKIGYKDYYCKINKRVNTVEEAIEDTKKVLGIEEIDGQQFSNEFWSSIFTQQDDKEDNLGSIKLCINTTEPLYSELMISKSLEAFATNILDKDEQGLYDNEHKKIRLYTSYEEFKKAEREERYNFSLAMNNGGDSVNLSNASEEFVMLCIPKNYKKVKTYDLSSITKIDKKFGKDYPVVHDYCMGYLNLNNKRKELKEQLNNPNVKDKDTLIKQIKIICRQLGEMKKDINTVLNELVRPIIWKQPLKDEGEADYDCFDFFDKKQVKELLKVKRGNDFQDDLSCIVYDLEKLIDKCEFNDNQEKILEMVRDGIEQERIGEMLGTTKQNISYAINIIINKIIKEYEKEYSNWYYLNKVKGTYKKCNRCGEIKLIQEFDILSTTKDGYNNTCKDCRK